MHKVLFPNQNAGGGLFRFHTYRLNAPYSLLVPRPLCEIRECCFFTFKPCLHILFGKSFLKQQKKNVSPLFVVSFGVILLCLSNTFYKLTWSQNHEISFSASSLLSFGWGRSARSSDVGIVRSIRMHLGGKKSE